VIDIKKYLDIARRGLTIQLAPSVFQGALNSLLQNISVEKIVDLVSKNASLWDTINPYFQENLRYIAVKAGGNLDWLTADWCIQAIKKQHPAIASLFLGWQKGHNWLVRQVAIIKEEVKS